MEKNYTDIGETCLVKAPPLLIHHFVTLGELNKKEGSKAVTCNTHGQNKKFARNIYRELEIYYTLVLFSTAAQI